MDMVIDGHFLQFGLAAGVRGLDLYYGYSLLALFPQTLNNINIYICINNNCAKCLNGIQAAVSKLYIKV